MMKLLPVVLICFFCAPTAALAQEQPVDVSACQLAKTPKTFDRKLVRVRGTLNVFFEDFSLRIEKCDTEQGIWLAFGGDVPGIVASTVNDNSRKPGSKLTVQGVSLGIEKDENFRRLYALISSRHGEKPDYTATATLTGMFFSGVEQKDARGADHFWGYGHLGCCSLLVITQVADVISVPPADLNINGVVIGPGGKPLEGITVIDDALGGSPPERQTTVTDQGGRFAFSDSGQQLRIENPRYRPLAITLQPGRAPIKVRLEDATRSDWVMRACSAGSSGRRIGFSVLYSLPKGMRASRFDSEGIRSLWVHRRGEDMDSAELIITHGLDRPIDDASSVDSKWMAERWIKDTEGNIIGIDALGGRRRGGYCRSVDVSGGDTAGYCVRSRKDSRALNQIIDSGCIAKPLSKSAQQ
jgi:hypothetical protein